MNQTRFNLRATVLGTKSIGAHQVKVSAAGRYVDEYVRIEFKMRTGNRNDAPRVNDDIIVTITTPAPPEGSNLE